MNRNLIILAIAVFAGLASCTKPTGSSLVKVTSSDTMFTLVNRSNRQLYVDMYNSLTDLQNKTNLRYSSLVPARNKYKIPFSQLDTTAINYYDIYTPDQSYSNWGSSSQIYGYQLFQEGHGYFIDSNILSRARYYFLKGNNITITWVAIDKRQSDNTSVWSSLDANGKYLKLVMTSAQTGRVENNFSGTINTENITNMNVYSSTSWGPDILEMYVYTSSNSYYLFNTDNVPVVGSASPSTDNIMLNDGAYYWVLAPQ
jgi:hypothetical protein